jgi:sarcosine oxidase subunit gamma
MSDPSVFNPIPSVAVERRSPLHDALAVFRPVGTGECRITLREHAFASHLMLRGNPRDPAFADSVARALGLPPPLAPCTFVRDEPQEVSIQWVSPDAWLINVAGDRAHHTETRLREALDGHFSVVNISGGQTIIELGGPAAREVLMKSTPYDVHPRNFPVGKAVGTVFAKAGPVMLRRSSEELWELIVRRSFADYVFRWLLDAGEQFGVRIAGRS